MQKGFSLVELAIVIAIIGLIAGGILAGTNMLRSADLRTVVSEMTRYASAIKQFEGQFRTLPGDYNKATELWGSASSCPTGARTGKQTCDGNGNRLSGFMSETYLTWQHLSNAGYIEEEYTGFVSPLTHTTAPTPGLNVPAGALKNTYWTFVYFSQLNTVNFEFGYAAAPDIRNHYLVLSGQPTAWWADPDVMTPQEAFSIDEKLDDGKPGSGDVRGSTWNTTGGCNTTTTLSTAEYNKASGSKICMLAHIIK